NTIFDLFLHRTYLDGGPADHASTCVGMVTAVHVDGTLNDPSDTDTGWSVELALPWSTLAEFAHTPAPPEPGDVWRMNFSRVEWRHLVVEGRYERIPGTKEDNWVWSPQGVINMHVPETWGSVEFVGPGG
ncbi:MAG: carbohydrate-binding family 9-like protein, partial [Planctomycetota bacterium]